MRRLFEIRFLKSNSNQTSIIIPSSEIDHLNVERLLKRCVCAIVGDLRYVEDLAVAVAVATTLVVVSCFGCKKQQI